MKLGFFVLNQWPVGDDMSLKIKEAVEQVAAAKEAGFSILATGQHFLSYPYQQPATMAYLARLAAAAEGMFLAPLVLLLPLLNPVEVAESVATLDAMCGGRVIMGAGLGYREEENTAFGSPASERLPRLLESLVLIKRLWTENELDFNGDFYTVPKVRIATRPLQRPHPPIWMAANADAAVRRSARQGYPWLINPHVTVATASRQIDMYRKLREEAGLDGPIDMPMIREVSVSRDARAAKELARPYLAPKYQAYAAWGQGDVLPGDETFDLPFDRLAANRFLLGSPQHVLDELRRYETQLGVTHMIVRMQWPGMPHDEVMRQIEIFGDSIIPHLGK